MRSRTLLLSLLGVVGVSIAIWWLFAGDIQHLMSRGASRADQADHPSGDKQKKDPNTVQVTEADRKTLHVETALSTRREIVEALHVPGTVLFDERFITHLKPRTSGRVLTLAVQAGDAVHKGEILATLDASAVLDARNGLESAKAALGEAVANKLAADTALSRARALLKIGGVASAEVERRDVQDAQAIAAMQSAQAKVDLFQAQYARLAPLSDGRAGTSAILSPIDGVVVSGSLTVGDVVDTSRDAFVVADPTRMIVRADLFGPQVEAVKPGDRVVVSATAITAQTFPATVSSVNAALDPLTNAAPARIEVANQTGQLKANMFVTIEIAADLNRRGVTIPASAVQLTEQGTIAFAERDPTTFVRRDLKLGVQTPQWVEVRSGIGEGERVATNGSFGLKSMLLRNLLGATD